MAMLEIRDLEVNYGAINAIKKISFDVNQGEVIALIGANGAGKTTTLHTITGLLKAKSGSVMFDGKELTKMPPHKIVEMGMAHVPVRTARNTRAIWRWSTKSSRVWKSVKTRLQARCPAASSRCWRWAGH